MKVILRVWRILLCFIVMGFGRWIADLVRGQTYRGTRLPLLPILLSITAGFVVLLCLRIPAPGYLWARACLGVGSLLGIVFGIPRSASQPPYIAPTIQAKAEYLRRY